MKRYTLKICCEQQKHFFIMKWLDKDCYIYGPDTLFDVALRYGIRGHLTSLLPMIIRRRFYLF